MSITLTAEERATSLAESFHSLHGAPGVRPWNPQKLDAWASSVAASGERHAAAFVLDVYNFRAEWKVGRFNLMHAVCVWDGENLYAFQMWACNPFTL